MKKRVAIIGAGFSGLSAAAYAAKAGHEVHVYEKHEQAGGRARQFTTPDGYVFDMGPSWYWMPDIMENFFSDFGCAPSDFYELVSLNPQFDIIFSDGKMNVPASYKELKALADSLEKKGGEKLDRFMQSARYKYEIGMRDFVSKPCHSWAEFISPTIARGAVKLNLFTNFRKYVSSYFEHPKLRTLMEFPVIFLGASPKKIPALYSLMNYGGYVLGTWYPMGGFHRVVQAMQQVAARQGAHFHFSHSAEKIENEQDKNIILRVNGREEKFDALIASSDYHHTETLLEKGYRNYDEAYWQSRTFAPSCLLFYLGLHEQIPNLTHHTLFFEHSMDAHLHSVYEEKKWPENPLFYACCPSKTDASVAPAGHENLFLLIPVAPGLHDDEPTRERYLADMLRRLEKHTGAKDLMTKIAYKKSYCVRDFMQDYNAYQGNAYGLANTLAQTAVLKPKIKNKKINRLFYTGQLTVPGPGMPPAILSGKIVAQEVHKFLQHEKII